MAAGASLDGGFEVLVVDDGSIDESWNEIQSLAQKFDNLKALRFRRNFGKSAAIRAGAIHARGEILVTMDADLQDDPSETAKLIEKLESENLDVVSGWKKVRKDPWSKRFASRVFNWMVSWSTGLKLHDHNCGFKAYRRDVLQEVNLYGDMHRFIPVLAAAKGFRVGELPVNHRSRKYGKSKYGLSRIPKGLLDLLTVCFLTGFKHRLHHLLGSVGLFSFFIGMAGLCLSLIHISEPTRPY